MTFVKPIVPQTFRPKTQQFVAPATPNNETPKNDQLIIEVYFPGGIQQSVTLKDANQTIGETIDRAVKLQKLSSGVPNDYVVTTNILTTGAALSERRDVLIVTPAGVHKYIYINPSKIAGGV